MDSNCDLSIIFLLCYLIDKVRNGGRWSAVHQPNNKLFEYGMICLGLPCHLYVLVKRRKNSFPIYSKLYGAILDGIRRSHNHHNIHTLKHVNYNSQTLVLSTYALCTICVFGKMSNSRDAPLSICTC